MAELKPCPVCGGIAEVYIGEKDLWKVGCADCRIFATDEKKDKAIRLWNEVNSKEAKADSMLKPCPFCGSTDVHLIDNDPGRSEVSITCKDCNVWVDHMFDAMSRDEAIELWNRRVKE